MDVVCTVPSEVAVSRTLNMAFAPSKNPRTSTPVTNVHNNATITTTLINCAKRGGRIRPSRRVPHAASLRRDRATMRMIAATTTVTSTITGQAAGEIGSLEKIRRTSFCQPTYCQIAETTIRPTRTYATILSHFVIDGRGDGICR